MASHGPRIHDAPVFTGFGASQWSVVLRRLAERLPPTSQRRVTIIGGVALALAYGSRRTTKDADVIMAADVAAEVLPAAATIAGEFALPADWMNQRAVEANLIMPPSGPGEPVLATASVLFDVPSTEHLLGMKLARFAGDTDIEDASLLLRKLRAARFEDVGDVWSFVGGLVPLAKRGQARHNLEVLWEMLDESA